MATTTPRIGLTKPDGTDLVDIAVLNTNFDKIDSNIASTKIQSTKPTTANAGDLWWDSDTGTLYLYYVDANSSQWVAATSDPINIGVVANQTERDAQYPTPAQGMSVYRTDLGVTQRYYGLYNLSTNPGGRDTAGWYNTEKSQGLVPIQPTTVTIATGTGSANAMGAVTFSGASSVTLDGVFSSGFSNYRIVFADSIFSTTATVYYVMRNGSSDVTGNYYVAGDFRDPANNSGGWNSNPGALADFGQGSPSAGCSAWTSDIFAPASSGVRTTGVTLMRGGSGGGTFYRTSFMHDTLIAYSGIKITVSTGTFSGIIQVFGYNIK